MDEIPLPAVIRPYFPLIKNILLAIVILIAGWIVSKWANRLTRAGFNARKLDKALGGFMASLFQYAVIAATIIAALGAVGIQTTSLVAVFASAGLAVGLALQGSLSNFASGVMILFFRPFDIDHKITAGGHTGAVREIGLFATTLLTLDNEVILVPNSAVTGGSIINYTVMGTVRGGVPISIAAMDDVAKVTELLLGAAKTVGLVLQKPAPEVVVTAGGKTLEMTLYVWTKSADLAPALHLTRIAVHEALMRASVAMPPPPFLVNVTR